MSWAVGYDHRWNRDIGYGVPATCDQPGCRSMIHRGLAYVCVGDPMLGNDGCGLYFCDQHLGYGERPMIRQCERCFAGFKPFDPTPDVAEWIRHKATDPSWAQWRSEQG